jgi:hypothetical protein
LNLMADLRQREGIRRGSPELQPTRNGVQPHTLQFVFKVGYRISQSHKKPYPGRRVD